jgi:hypothetical protein
MPELKTADMTNTLMAALCLLFIVGCDLRKGVSPAAETSTRNVRPLPVIAVSGSEIRINGTTVWLGDTLDNWKRALGGTADCYDEGIVICVWHANGFVLGTDGPDKTRVKFMTLHLTIEPAAPGERTASWPRSPFRGTFELDGVPIDSTTIFRDVRRQVPAARELRCGDRSCGHPIAAFSDGANIHIALVGRSEKSPILDFSISCTSTKACNELLPGQRKKVSP